MVTFRSGLTKVQVDYFLIRVNDRMLCKDCKVIPSEYLGTQLRLLVMDVVTKNLKRKKRSVRVSEILGLDGGILLQRTLLK